MGNKKIYRSRHDRMICGVCGGLGELFAVDSTIVRLIWALLVCCAGTGLLAYIVCAIIIPESPY